MRKMKVWAIFAVTVAMAACTNEVGELENNDSTKFTKYKSLQVTKVSTSNMNVVTRASATAVDSWTDGSSIGVSVLRTVEGGKVLKKGTFNVTHTYNSSEDSWGGTPINLFDGDEGYVTAYYPYSASVNDLERIWINATVDWMYAPLSDNKKISYDTPQTTLSMRHANAQIIVNLVRDGYTSTGSVSAFSVKSVKFGQAASLNSLTGELSGHSLVTNNTFSTSTAMTLADDISSSSTAKITPIQEWFVPVTDAAADVVFKTEIDGFKFRYTTTQKFESGHIYTYTLAITNSGQEALTLSKVSITDWEDEEKSEDMGDLIPAERIAVDLGLPSGLKWAQGNLGAEEETDYGLYYGKGCRTGYGESEGHNFKEGETLRTGELSDAAANKLGGTWRKPTDVEYKELLDNCKQVYFKDYNGTGVDGFLLTSKTNGKTLFMPYGGYIDGTVWHLDGLRYWTSGGHIFLSWSNGSGLYIEDDTAVDWPGYNIRAVCE